MVPDPDSSPNSSPSVETRLAVIQIKVDQLLDLNRTRGEDHEQRLRKLEDRKFPLPTVSVLVAITALAVAIITYLIGR